MRGQWMDECYSATPVYRIIAYSNRKMSICYLPGSSTSMNRLLAGRLHE